MTPTATLCCRSSGGPVIACKARPSRRQRPLHVRPASLALVLCGGAVGAASREAVSQAIPAAQGAFPVATMVVNLTGAFVLGLLLEILVRSGDDMGWRHKARLLGGTGFCGAFTTYSTLAVETVQLARHSAAPTALVYLAASVTGGLLATAAGIAVGAARYRAGAAALPVDADLERVEAP